MLPWCPFLEKKANKAKFGRRPGGIARLSCDELARALSSCQTQDFPDMRKPAPSELEVSSVSETARAKRCRQRRERRQQLARDLLARSTKQQQSVWSCEVTLISAEERAQEPRPHELTRSTNFADPIRLHLSRNEVERHDWSVSKRFANVARTWGFFDLQRRFDLGDRDSCCFLLVSETPSHEMLQLALENTPTWRDTVFVLNAPLSTFLAQFPQFRAPAWPAHVPRLQSYTQEESQREADAVEQMLPDARIRISQGTLVDVWTRLGPERTLDQSGFKLWLARQKQEVAMAIWKPVDELGDWPYAYYDYHGAESFCFTPVLDDGSVFLGSMLHLRGTLLKAHKVDVVVSVGEEEGARAVERNMRGVVTRIVDLKDDSMQSAFPHFDGLVSFMRETRAQGRRTLVHCRMGVSRSATMVLAFLMAEFRTSLGQALLMLRQRRSFINPNIRFQRDLLAWEYHLFGKRLTLLF